MWMRGKLQSHCSPLGVCATTPCSISEQFLSTKSIFSHELVTPAENGLHPVLIYCSKMQRGSPASGMRVCGGQRFDGMCQSVCQRAAGTSFSDLKSRGVKCLISLVIYFSQLWCLDWVQLSSLFRVGFCFIYLLLTKFSPEIMISCMDRLCACGQGYHF